MDLREVLIAKQTHTFVNDQNQKYRRLIDSWSVYFPFVPFLELTWYPHLVFSTLYIFLNPCCQSITLLAIITCCKDQDHGMGVTLDFSIHATPTLLGCNTAKEQLSLLTFLYDPHSRVKCFKLKVPSQEGDIFT